jgi:hypothetical protein
LPFSFLLSQFSEGGLSEVILFPYLSLFLKILLVSGLKFFRLNPYEEQRTLVDESGMIRTQMGAQQIRK